METERAKTINGVDLSRAQAMREAVMKQPKSAWAKFQARATWKTAFYNESTIDEFWLGGNKNSRVKPFGITSDHPPELMGTNKGALPPEILLDALSHCITNNFASYGAGMGIKIDSLVTQIEGDIDLQGTMGLPEPGKVRPGYQELRATYYIKSDATMEQLEKLAKISEDLSPTRDSLRAVKFSSKIIKV